MLRFCKLAVAVIFLSFLFVPPFFFPCNLCRSFFFFCFFVSFFNASSFLLLLAFFHPLLLLLLLFFFFFRIIFTFNPLKTLTLVMHAGLFWAAIVAWTTGSLTSVFFFFLCVCVCVCVCVCGRARMGMHTGTSVYSLIRLNVCRVCTEFDPGEIVSPQGQDLALNLAMILVTVRLFIMLDSSALQTLSVSVCLSLPLSP